VTNSSSSESWDPHNEFDPITLTYSGDVVWHDYCNPPHIVVTKPGESPRDVVARERAQMKFRFHVEQN
jgi:hypothetical protein